MTTFLNSKRWELLLAAATPFVLTLLDAWQSGAFHGKDIATGMVIALGIILRAAASHKQDPPGTPPTVTVTTTSGTAATVGTVPPPTP